MGNGIIIVPTSQGWGVGRRELGIECLINSKGLQAVSATAAARDNDPTQIQRSPLHA